MLSLSTTNNMAMSSLLYHLLHNVFTYADEITLEPSLQSSLACLSLHSCDRFFKPINHRFDSLQDPSQYVFVCLALGNPEMESAFHMSQQH